MIIEPATVFTNGQMVMFIKENGRMANVMEKVRLSGKMVVGKSSFGDMVSKYFDIFEYN